jgi:hypothetical protein
VGAPRRGRPAHVRKDLAEAQRRVKAARTPVAKAVTKQVLEKKRAAYGIKSPAPSTRKASTKKTR